MDLTAHVKAWLYRNRWTALWAWWTIAFAAAVAFGPGR